MANTAYDKRDGFTGRKIAYFDTVTFRFMPEGGARTAGLQTGELQVLESLDVAAAKRLKDDKSISIYPVMPWGFLTLMMNANWGLTANLDIRRAIQSALDLEEILAIASDGNYRLDPAWQYAGTNYYPGIDGLDRFARPDPAKAKQLLQAGGYKGEELQLVADTQAKVHLDAGTVAAEQLRAIGMKVNFRTMDWPTVIATRTKPDGWNLWPLVMGIEPYEGPYNVVGFFAGTQTVQIKQDPVIEDANNKLATVLDLDGRRAAVKAFQARLYDQAIAIKAGDGPTINMTVIHNHFYWGHGMSIGSETNGGVSGIRVEDLSLDGPDNGLRIKSNPTRGGLVEDVVYHDICIRDSKYPILFDSTYAFPGKGVTELPVYQDITLRAVRILGGGKIQFNGFDHTHRVSVTLDGVMALDATARYKPQASHTDLTFGPGPVNFIFTGNDSTVTGKKTGGSLPSCSSKFVPFP